MALVSTSNSGNNVGYWLTIELKKSSNERLLSSLGHHQPIKFTAAALCSGAKCAYLNVIFKSL
jgi:hypothetical protein